VKGVQPTSFQDIVNRVNEAKYDNKAMVLPVQAELDDAASRVGLQNPINPLQRDSLANQQVRDIYLTSKEAPGELGATLQNYEALQKNELVGKTDQAIKNLSPGLEPVADAYEGGQRAIDAFSNQYQAEKSALSPIFENMKS
ncbi:hypothetical protein, partial [Brachyspira hyodysenteriae]|uniref:hypothetical protein n=1 Tax=Brachyspira hyodysenteriae TaxID=159 RepID=UPI0015C43F0F